MTASLPKVVPGQDELRFGFGKNWGRFLEVLDDERIAEAEHSLVEMLEMPDLHGKCFLDVGSGSGLFSLAAKRLGATRVHSFDYDKDSVASTLELKRRFHQDDTQWTIEQGSVLDEAYLRTLGKFDIVYSWGVLHHTGDMWRALANTTELVRAGGRLFIALYNDQGHTSRRWLMLKRMYNRAPRPVKLAMLLAVQSYWEVRALIGRVMRLETPLPFKAWREKKHDRGMSVWHDCIDWVGGYPFQVSKPEEVFDFCRARGFALQRLKTAGGGLGNNQFVFVRDVT